MALTRKNLIPMIQTRVEGVLVPLGARDVRVAYMGRQVMLDEQGHIVAGVVDTTCEFITPSGFRRTIEIPVNIVQGHVISPSMGFVEGKQAFLSAELFKGINDAGTMYGSMPVGEHMYASPYHSMEAYKKIEELVKRHSPIRRFTHPY